MIDVEGRIFNGGGVLKGTEPMTGVAQLKRFVIKLTGLSFWYLYLYLTCDSQKIFLVPFIDIFLRCSLLIYYRIQKQDCLW